MPFHPTCFEIFTRASRLRHHRIDVAGLAGWRNLMSDYDDDDMITRHPAVLDATEQWWNHRSGDEWLAANPVIVPLLPSLLRRAVRKRDDILHDRSRTTQDPLTKLPREIADMIVGLLAPIDKASLRLASCATHLPIHQWQELLQEEMPWFWEAWDDADPSPWCTTSAVTLEWEMQRQEGADKLRDERSRVVAEEMPEIFEAWCADKGWLGVESRADMPPFSVVPVLDLPFVKLPAHGTNWCRVYYEIKLHWDELPGLHNRQRIWTDVEMILGDIQRFRDQGKILPIHSLA